MIQVYCPLCCCEFEIELGLLSPGSQECTCPLCRTRWRIEIQFYEEDDNAKLGNVA